MYQVLDADLARLSPPDQIEADTAVSVFEESVDGASAGNAGERYAGGNH